MAFAINPRSYTTSVDSITEPVDMRTGADRLLAQVVQMLGAAQHTMPGCSPTAAATG